MLKSQLIMFVVVNIVCCARVPNQTTLIDSSSTEYQLSNETELFEKQQLNSTTKAFSKLRNVKGYGDRNIKFMLKARGLHTQENLGRAPNPFVEIQGAAKYARSSILTNTHNPEWQNVFTAFYHPAEIEYVEVTINDSGPNGYEAPIGHVRIKVAAMLKEFHQFNEPVVDGSGTLVINTLQDDVEEFPESEEEVKEGLSGWVILGYVVAAIAALIVGLCATEAVFHVRIFHLENSSIRICSDNY